MLTIQQGSKLIELAHHAVDTIVLKQNLFLDPYKEFSEAKQFVLILHKDSEVRTVDFFNATSLYKDVVRAARQIAFEDGRYYPVKEEEIGKIKFEIAIIEKAELLRVRDPLEYYNLIKIGRDGIMVQAGPYKALVLPHEPLENGWDVERALQHVCQKAGIPMDAWKNASHYQIFSFKAQVFEEVSKGKVVEK